MIKNQVYHRNQRKILHFLAKKNTEKFIFLIFVVFTHPVLWGLLEKIYYSLKNQAYHRNQHRILHILAEKIFEKFTLLEKSIFHKKRFWRLPCGHISDAHRNRTLSSKPTHHGLSENIPHDLCAGLFLWDLKYWTDRHELANIYID